jgi:hypothetical protein
MNRMKDSLQTIVTIGMLIIGGACATAMPAAAGETFSQGQVVYAGAFSHVLIGDKGRPFDLSITLCIRNTDTDHGIALLSVDYHDSDGKLVKKHLNEPQSLSPLATVHFFVSRSDVSGGLSPSFIVRWKSAAKVSEPIVEAAMIGDRSGQGVSFVTRGKVVRDSPE